MKGEACAAAADCGAGLRCLRETCVDERTFDAARKLTRSKVSRTYGYVGGAFGAALPAWASGSLFLPAVGEGAQLALVLGKVWDDLQLELQLTPATAVISNVASSPFIVPEIVGSVAYLPRLSAMVSWLLRLGAGGGVLLAPSYLGNGFAAFGFAEARLDVFGVVIHARHLMVEITTPSCRFFGIPASASSRAGWVLSWVTGFAVDYVL